MISGNLGLIRLEVINPDPVPNPESQSKPLSDK